MTEQEDPDKIPTAAIASDSAVPEYTDYGLFEMDEGDELVRRKDAEELKKRAYEKGVKDGFKHGYEGRELEDVVRDD